MDLHNQNNQSYPVMFHHFHNESHPSGQGSLSSSEFNGMLDWLTERYSLLSAAEYHYKFMKNKLLGNDICLTFDDALLCQIDIAAPILKARNLQAFYFVYSSPFLGNPDYLEIYRYFRMTAFGSVEDFYLGFFKCAEQLNQDHYMMSLAKYDENEYLKAFPFYTKNDKLFRYVRDITLGQERYEHVMHILMTNHSFDPLDALGKLWMQDQDLRNLSSDGNVIGLHSYSHPTMMHRLDKESQLNEYVKNHDHISEILNKQPYSMSHPCGNYNDDTFSILENLNISIGFRSSCSVNTIKSKFEIPRQDHANISKEMRA